MKKPPTKKERMWAVEQAIKWPQVTVGMSGTTIQSYGGGMGVIYQDADVIARANILLKFIQGVK